MCQRLDSWNALLSFFYSFFFILLSFYFSFYCTLSLNLSLSIHISFYYSFSLFYSLSFISTSFLFIFLFLWFSFFFSDSLFSSVPLLSFNFCSFSLDDFGWAREQKVMQIEWIDLPALQVEGTNLPEHKWNLPNSAKICQIHAEFAIQLRPKIIHSLEFTPQRIHVSKRCSPARYTSGCIYSTNLWSFAFKTGR